MKTDQNKVDRVIRTRAIVLRVGALLTIALVLTLAGTPTLDWAAADDAAIPVDETPAVDETVAVAQTVAVDGTPFAEDSTDASVNAEPVTAVETVASPVAEPAPESEPAADTTGDAGGANGNGVTSSPPVDADTVTTAPVEPPAPAITVDGTATTGDGSAIAEEVAGDVPSLAEGEGVDVVLNEAPMAEMTGDGTWVVAPSFNAATVNGFTSITPNNAQSVAAGTVAVYTHLVEHLRPGTGNDVKNITAISLHGWSVALFKENGVTPLPDTNGDGIPDTGKLTRGKSATIVVKVTVPTNLPLIPIDLVTVTARSVDNPLEAAFAIDTTTVLPTLTLTINTSAVNFGTISPAGNVNPAAPGVISQADGTGATYVAGSAVTVTVTSTTGWSGSCQAAENSGSAAAISIGGGRLTWRFAGGSSWTAFTVTSPSPPLGDGCLPNPGTGVTVYTYDYGLRVVWTDEPGTFNSVVTYVAVP